jgi:hypothetical protein
MVPSSTLYMKKKSVTQKRSKQLIFSEIKDDHVLYSYKEDSPWNNFPCFLGKKNRHETPYQFTYFKKLSSVEF